VEIYTCNAREAVLQLTGPMSELRLQAIHLQIGKRNRIGYVAFARSSREA